MTIKEKLSLNNMTFNELLAITPEQLSALGIENITTLNPDAFKGEAVAESVLTSKTTLNVCSSIEVLFNCDQRRDSNISQKIQNVLREDPVLRKDFLKGTSKQSANRNAPLNAALLYFARVLPRLR